MSAPTPAEVAAARTTLASALRVVVLTGAGVSAESGIPTFRGAGGLWKQLRPEELATPIAFGRDPRLVWEWYASRRGAVQECRPNAAHLALARWMLARPGVTLVSQNVDDLHERRRKRSPRTRTRRTGPNRSGCTAPSSTTAAPAATTAWRAARWMPRASRRSRIVRSAAV